MVSEITIFEPHFEGAQFGPASLGSNPAGSAEGETSESEGVDEAAGRSRKLAIAGVVLVATVLAMWYVRSRRSGDAPTEGDEAAADSAVGGRIPLP